MEVLYQEQLLHSQRACGENLFSVKALLGYQDESCLLLSLLGQITSSATLALTR